MVTTKLSGILVAAALGVALTLTWFQRGRPHEAASAGGGVRVPVLQQLSVPSGSTAVVAAAGVRYELLGASPAEADAIVQALRRRAYFRGADGSTVRAQVLREPIARTRLDPVKGAVEMDLQPTVLRLVPTLPLQRDTWYTLRIAADPSYAVRAMDVASSEGEIDFFTGSAPQVRYVSFSDPAKGGEHIVQVFMSEPVNLASAGANFGLGGWSGPMRGCVHREGSCLDARASMVMSGFDFRVEGADGAVGPYVERIAMREGMRGAGRSVGESMKVTGAHRGLARNASVEYVISPNEWFHCAGDAKSWCWVAPRNR